MTVGPPTARMGNMATRIRVSLGVTMNTGNFESVRIDYSDERDVPEGVPVAKAREALYAEAEEFISKKMEEVRSDTA